MLDYQPNLAGAAQALPLSFPQQSTSAPYQAPSALMDQIGYFPHYTNQHEFSSGLNTSVTGEMSQINSQQQKMGESLSASHNANAAVSPPVVVSSRQFSPTQQAYKTPSPSTPSEVANASPKNLLLNQASVDNIQTFMTSNQAQGMQIPFAYPRNHMGVNGMPMMGGMQTGSMSMQSPSMDYVQYQYANNPMMGYPPGSMMGYGQNQPQSIANSQAFLGASGMYGANSMQNIQSSCMIGVQHPFQNNAQQVQGYHPHVSSTLRPTATPFTPSQGNLAEPQQMAYPAAKQFQGQGLVCGPLATLQHAQGPQHTPVTRKDGMHQTLQATQVSPTSHLTMQQSPQGQCSMRKPIRKQSPKRGRATQSAQNVPKRRCKPSDNTVLTKSNELKTGSPMSRVQSAMCRVAYGKTIPQGVKHMEMTAKPKPDISIADYLGQPQQLPISSPSLEVQQPTSPTKIVQSRTPSIELISSQLTSRHHALTPPTPPSVQPLPTSPAQHSANTKEKADKYPLSDKEKTIRDAEARNAPIPPSQRRLVRYERDDPRLQRDSNGEPITPEADMYNVYFVAPPTEISMDTINELVASFRREKQQKQATNAAGNDGNSKTKAAKSKSKPLLTPTPTPRAKKGRQNKGVRKLTSESAEKITVNKRNKAITTVSTLSASLSPPAALSTSPIAACHDKNDNAIASQLSLDNITDIEGQPISTAEATVVHTASFDFVGSHQTTSGAGSVAQPVPVDEFNIQQSFTQDAPSSDEYNNQAGVSLCQQSPALQPTVPLMTRPTETASASDSLQTNGEQPLNAGSEVSEASLEDLFSLLAPVQQYNESFMDQPIEWGVPPAHESPTTKPASTEPESYFENVHNSICETSDKEDLSWFLQTMPTPIFKDPSAGATSISSSLDLDLSSSIACLQAEFASVSDPDAEYINTPGHNDISVMTVEIPNAPPMGLDDMPYSPIRLSPPPLTGPYNPPSNPEFKPRDPFNTVLDDANIEKDTEEKKLDDTAAVATKSTNKRKMNEGTVTAPNKKPRTRAPPSKLVLPQCEVRHNPAVEQ
ncbi:uncharacterized protein FIESC28_09729 [Fusarium coffeatum]|uniref:Uncharacterized protein n=1 Tax=Fusarium coffeatum TaxID=231269 RepID=A0A366R0L2_9HYPO|nr:uncharacterized protein FIESC28_09729 [Fusarium coffeatum]RBR09800.1 hypothetical protein FIESC28_09729 [Fusarium coffeatum]